MRTLVSKYWAMPLLNRLFVGGAWAFFGSSFSRLLALVTAVVIARLLGVENFGKLVILQSTLSMFGVLAGLGVGVVATKFIAELKIRDAERLGKILSLLKWAVVIAGLVIGICLALSANLVAEKIIHKPSLEPLIVMISFSVFFLTVDGYNSSALVGFEAIKRSATGLIFANLLALPLSIILTLNLGLTGAVGGIVLTSFFQCLTSSYLLRKTIRGYSIKQQRFSLCEWRILLHFALPALLGSAFVAPAYWVTQVLLINSPNGTVQMALLGVGLQWFQAIYFFPLAFGRVVLPIVTDQIAGGSHGNARSILKYSIIANAIITIPIAILIIVMSKWIVQMYGIYDDNAWAVLSLLVFAAILSSICDPVGQVMHAKGKNWYGAAMNLGWAIVFIVGSYFCINFGAFGVALSLTLAYILHLIWVSAWVFSNLDR